MKSSFEQNGGTYRQVGDYLIPNLTLSPEEMNIKIGKWGQMHRDYLQKNKPVIFATLLAQGNLWQYLADIDEQANEMYDNLVARMADNDGVTEELKATDQMRWVGLMNKYKNCAEEIICSTLIFT